jgi:hypothetical protein
MKAEEEGPRGVLSLRLFSSSRFSGKTYAKPAVENTILI